MNDPRAYPTPDVWPELLELDEQAEWVTTDDGSETWRITSPEPVSDDPGRVLTGHVIEQSADDNLLKIRWDHGFVETRHRTTLGVEVRTEIV